MAVYLLLTLVVLLTGCTTPVQDPVVDNLLRLEAVDAVDPLVGTGGLGAGVGMAFPGASLPRGMAKLGPATASSFGAPGFYHTAGYYHPDTHIRGFASAHVHGMGVADYGHYLWMISDGVPQETESGGLGEASAQQPFAHTDEEASPGYYRVGLPELGTQVELTATQRGGLLRIPLPPDMADPVLILDLGHALGEGSISFARASWADGAIDAEVLLQGSYSSRMGGLRFFLHGRLDTPPEAVGHFNHSSVSWAESSVEDPDGGLLFRFAPNDATELVVRFALSPVDAEGARTNFEAELLGRSFDEVRASARTAWSEELSVMELGGGDEGLQRRLYTALYQMMLEPTLYTDVDGRYPGFDGTSHVAEGFTWYSDLSLWDTFRTFHPLVTLLDPSLSHDMVRSLMAMAEQGGMLPRWPIGSGYTGGMTGSHADLVLSDAVLKGVEFDHDLALEQMLTVARGTHEPGLGYGGRWQPDRYRALGFQPVEAGGNSTSNTLEWAWDDAGIAATADHLGYPDVASEFSNSSGFWRNVYDSDQGFFHGRREDGSFQDTLDPLRWEGEFVEGDAWQFLWSVPQDPDGLADVLGGTDAAIERLEYFFHESSLQEDTPGPDPWYWHGNEPDIHAAWMFSLWGRRDLAAEWSHWILDTRYDMTPAGLDGNDDFGTLSSWAILAAAGLYPIPSRSDWLLSAPVLPELLLHLPEGDLLIRADREDLALGEVRFTTATGAVHQIDSVGIEHALLAGGGVLDFGPSR